jgi:hypothetical protein
MLKLKASLVDAVALLSVTLAADDHVIPASALDDAITTPAQ